jgi:hypothetical protein
MHKETVEEKFERGEKRKNRAQNIKINELCLFSHSTKKGSMNFLFA